MNKYTLFALLATVSMGVNAQTGLFINEVMQANIDMFLDPSFNFGSWMELYNHTDQDMDLNGYYLTDTPDSMLKYPISISDATVPANGFLVLWFGNYDKTYYPNQIDLDIDCDGGYLALSAPDGSLVDELWYPESVSRTSWARKSDAGVEWGRTAGPTPAASNQQSEFAQERLPDPIIDTESLLFDDSVSFSVSFPVGAVLRYTLDGTTPTLQNGMVATGAMGADGLMSASFSLDETTVMRFRLFQEGMLPSAVLTRSFIYRKYNFNAPVISIVTDPRNLYDTEFGIFVKGPNGLDGNGQTDLCNWNRNWDRPVNFEFMDARGNVLVNQESDMCPSGRYSRAFSPHPFKMKAKKKYDGQNTYRFTPFQEKPFNRYRTLKFRNSSTDASTRDEDAFLHEILIRSGLNLDCQCYVPVHHYINGKYMGTINLSEPSNEVYVQARTGYDEDEIDMFKIDHRLSKGGYSLMAGTRDSYDQLFRLSKTAYVDSIYDKLCQILDVDEFANYMAVQMYVNNGDWPRNNIKAYRPRAEDGRFRFILFDVDYVFGQSGNPFKIFDEETRSDLVPIFNGLMSNSRFKKLFIDSYSIVAGSVFEPERCLAIVDELGRHASAEMAFAGQKPDGTIEKLKKHLTASYQNDMVYYMIDYLRIPIAKKRIRTDIASNVDGALLTINGLPVPTGRFKGLLFLPDTLVAHVPGGYRFMGWTDEDGNVVCRTPEFVLDLKVPKVLRAIFEPVVPAGNEPLLRINEVCSDNGFAVNEWFKKGDWIEIYNPTDQEVNMKGMMLSDTPDRPDRFVIDQDYTVPARGYAVIWCDKQESQGWLHAPFKLDNSDSMVLLTASDGTWTDVFHYCRLRSSQSVGLYPDGGIESFVMNAPTIGRRNILSWYDNANSNPAAIEAAAAAAVVQLQEPGIAEIEGIYTLDGKKIENPQNGVFIIRMTDGTAVKMLRK